MVAGFITTTRGRGCRAAITTKNEAGGGLRWSRLSSSTFHLATTFVGIRCPTTNAILTPVTTTATIRITEAAGAVMVAVVTDVTQVAVATAKESIGAV
jgi:hypothetical protein